MSEPSLRLNPQTPIQLITLRQRRTAEARQILSTATSQVDQLLANLDHACEVLSSHQTHQRQIQTTIAARPRNAPVSAVLLRQDHKHIAELARHETSLKARIAQTKHNVEKSRKLAAASRLLLMQCELREKQARDLLERVLTERRAAQEQREEQDIAELAMMRQSSAPLTRQHGLTTRQRIR